MSKSQKLQTLVFTEKNFTKFEEPDDLLKTIRV